MEMKSLCKLEVYFRTPLFSVKKQMDNLANNTDSTSGFPLCCHSFIFFQKLSRKCFQMR